MEVNEPEGGSQVSEDEVEHNLSENGDRSLDETENNSDEDTDSVKILPLTHEQKLQQLEDIDNDMYDKLTELKEVLTQSGLRKSLELLSKYLKGNELLS